MIDWFSDVRVALRALVKNPSYALVVILTLALGIGATTAIFSVVRGVVLRPLPYDEADRLVVLSELREDRELSMSRPNVEDVERQTQVFAEVAAFRGESYNLITPDGTDRVTAYQVTSGFFDVLGVTSVLGRGLASWSIDDGRVAVVSHRMWQDRLGGQDDVLDRTLNLDGNQFRVIGVMPPGIEFYRNADLWVPLEFYENAEELERRDAHPGLYAVARLRSDVDLETARTELASLAGRLEREYPESNMGHAFKAVTLEEDVVGSDTRRSLWIFQWAALLVLLIACANVASLLAARASVRVREVAIRTALGAQRGRLVRQFLTESLVLALVGGAAGVLLAVGTLRLLVAFDPGNIPRIDEVRIDILVLLVALAVSVAAGLLFGLVPLVQSWRPRVQDNLREGSGGATGASRWHRMRQGLVAAEVALSLVLLTAAVLLIESFVALVAVEPGFDTERLVTVRLSLPEASYPDWHDRRAFYDRLVEQVAAIPGVAFASIVNPLPLSGFDRGDSISAEGRPYTNESDLVQVDYGLVSPDYFESMGIPLLAGRTFFEDEGEGPPPTRVIVSQRTADALWPGESPLGRRLKPGPPDEGGPWSTVVGVVGDVQAFGARGRKPLQLYYPYDHIPLAGVTLVARSEGGDPTSLLPAIRREVNALDSTVPLYAVTTMEGLYDQSVAQPRFSALLLALFALVALVLSLVGVYGVVAYAVTQRTREIGLRIALGARGGEIRKLVLRQGLTPVLLGVLVGIVGSIAATRLLESLLYGVEPSEPTAFVVVALVLVGVGVLGSLVPALRASRVDPTLALRYD